MERFEALLPSQVVAPTSTSTSLSSYSEEVRATQEYSFMRLKVYEHLKLCDNAFDWGVETFHRIGAALSSLKADLDVSSCSVLVSEVAVILRTTGTSSTKVLERSVPKLFQLHLKFTTDLKKFQSTIQPQRLQATTSQTQMKPFEAKLAIFQTCVSVLTNLLDHLRETYGEICLSEQCFAEATASFLLHSTPLVSKAILAARSAQDWSRAMTLSRLYSSVIPIELSTVRLASDIIAEYR